MPPIFEEMHVQTFSMWIVPFFRLAHLAIRLLSSLQIFFYLLRWGIIYSIIVKCPQLSLQARYTTFLGQRAWLLPIYTWLVLSSLVHLMYCVDPSGELFILFLVGYDNMNINIYLLLALALFVCLVWACTYVHCFLYLTIIEQHSFLTYSQYVYGMIRKWGSHLSLQYNSCSKKYDALVCPPLKLS